MIIPEADTVEILVTPHAVHRAHQRDIPLGRREIRAEVRAAMRAGRTAGRKPPWADDDLHVIDPGHAARRARVRRNIFAWTEDERVVFAVAGGDTAWHVKTVMPGRRT